MCVQESGDMDKLSRVMFVMLCHVTCVAKQLAFHVHAARIDTLVAGLDGECRRAVLAVASARVSHRT